MDKDLIEGARMSIQSLREILQDIDDTLKKMHEQAAAQEVLRAYEQQQLQAALEGAQTRRAMNPLAPVSSRSPLPR